MVSKRGYLTFLVMHQFSIQVELLNAELRDQFEETRKRENSPNRTLRSLRNHLLVVKEVMRR